MTDTDLLSSAEAALILRCSDRQVRQLAAEGVLPRIRLGSRWWFRRASLLAWLAAQERPGSTATAPVTTRRQAIERRTRQESDAEAVAAMVARHDALREEVRRDQARQSRRVASGGANVVDLTVRQDGAASSVSAYTKKA